MAQINPRTKRTAARPTSRGLKTALKAAAVVVVIKVTLEVALVAFWRPPRAVTREAI